MSEFEKEGVSRRDFVKGSIAAGAAAAVGAALAGCTSPSVSSSSHVDARADAQTEANAASSLSAGANTGGANMLNDDKIGPSMKATANLENAQPIDPLPVPENWDGEADIIIIGSGGAGMAGSVRATDLGNSVIVFEKSASLGGATRHGCSFLVKSGSGTLQKEQEYGYPEAPYDRAKFVKAVQPVYQFSINNNLLGNLADAGGVVADWLLEKGAPLTCIGMRYIPTPVIDGVQTNMQGQAFIIDHMEQVGRDAGVDYRLSTECTGLVQDGDGRIVGVRVESNGSEEYYQANKGVVLCSGGFGMNPDMVKRYTPTAYEGAAYGGPFPSHSGDMTRMAIGAGADMAGYDSWSMWEAAPDNGTGEWQYFWGFRQFCQMPWLNFDRTGKRCDVFDNRLRETDPQYPAFDADDTGRVAVQASRPGARTYMIFDSHYEENTEKIQAPGGEHRPLTPQDKLAEQTFFDPDVIHVEFDKAVADGRIKKADTLEELAALMGLDADVVTGVVDRWNACCEAGEDTDPDVLYHYLPEWLNPIKDGPFYGAALGGQIGKTLCGVRVDENLQVLDAEGHTIPGLYAAFTTAGGIVGEANYGGNIINTSILGGVALSWTSGYVATESAAKT